MIISGIIFVIVGVACILVSGIILDKSIFGSVACLALGLLSISLGIIDVYDARTSYFYKAYPEIKRTEYKLDKIDTLEKELLKLKEGLE